MECPGALHRADHVVTALHDNPGYMPDAGSIAEQLIDAVRARTIELYGRPAPCFDAGDPAAEAVLDLGQVRREHDVRVSVRHGSQ